MLQTSFQRQVVRGEEGREIQRLSRETLSDDQKHEATVRFVWTNRVQ